MIKVSSKCCKSGFRKSPKPYKNHYNINIIQKDPSIPKCQDQDYLVRYRKEYNIRRNKENKKNKKLLDKILPPTVSNNKVLVSFD